MEEERKVGCKGYMHKEKQGETNKERSTGNKRADMTRS
jgi:hypothetical protein